MNYLLVVFLLHFPLLVPVIKAQEPIQIKEIQVEAKAEKDAVEKQKQAGSATLTISKKDLNNFGHHAAGDVLKRLPFMVLQGPPGFNRNVMMAGLDKEFQNVLINGNRTAGGEDSRDLKLDRIPMDLIERIDIIYDPPVSLGADATIGAVDVILKDVPEKKFLSADLSTEYTSTHPGLNPEFSVSCGNKLNKWSFLGGYSLSQFDRINLNRLHDSVYQGTENEKLHVLINAFNGAVAYQPDSSRTIKYQFFYTNYHEKADFLADVKLRTKGGLNMSPDTAFDDKLRWLHSHTFSYNLHKNRLDWKNELNVAQNFDSKDRWRYRDQDGETEISYEDEFQRNSEASVKSELVFKKRMGNSVNQIKTGIRASAFNRNYDRLVFTKLAGHKFWDNVEDGSYDLNEMRTGIFVTDEFSAGKWWVSPSLRFDSDWGNYTTAIKNGSMHYRNLNPSVHVKYALSANRFIKADFSRQIARPPFNLMVPVDKVKNKKSVIERGNPDLVPSTAWNMGIGTEQYLNDKSFITVRGFYSILRNVVETRYVGVDDLYGFRILQSVNVDSGLVWGININTRLDMEMIGLPNFTFGGNLSWLGSQVRDPGTFELRRLNDQPEWIANGFLDYLNTKLKIQASFGVNYLGRRETASTIEEGSVIDALVQTPFLQCDARLKYFFSSWGSIYLNVVNIFDETIDLQQGSVNESEIQGCNIRIGISMQF